MRNVEKNAYLCMPKGKRATPCPKHASHNSTIMKSLWRSFLGFAEDDDPKETYEHAVSRAKRLMDEGNHEDACRILRYAERYDNAEAMFMLGQCHWNGNGVVEDAGRAIRLWKKAASMGHEGAAKRCEKLKDLIASESL